MSRRQQARSAKTLETILAAAEALIAREGLTSLTLDAVAAEAGVSKGGLQHHFPSKEALIAGLVSRKLTTIRHDNALREGAMAGERNPALRALLQYGRHQYGCEAGFPRALLVAAIQNAEALGGFRDLLAEDLRRIRLVTRRPDEASLLVFATLGLLLSDALGFASLRPDEAEAIFAALERHAEALD